MNGKDTTAPNTDKHPGGRPTKYDDSFVKKVDEYLLSIEELSVQKLPTLAGFAVFIDAHRESVLNWANARVKDEQGNKTKRRLHPEFFDAIKKIETKQQDLLINDGFYGGKDVNANMAIFLLKVNHGMVETEHIDHTTKGKEIPTPIYGSKSTE